MYKHIETSPEERYVFGPEVGIGLILRKITFLHGIAPESKGFRAWFSTDEDGVENQEVFLNINIPTDREHKVRIMEVEFSHTGTFLNIEADAEIGILIEMYEIEPPPSNLV